MKPLYPQSFDNEDNLFTVRDGLRVTLADDYTVGDTSITVSGDPSIMSQFPPTGIVTITEQCSEISARAISFHYTSKTDNSFDGLTLLEGFTDSGKPRGAHVTQNVMAQHHNIIKDVAIALENEIGTVYDETNIPSEGSITARLNILKENVLRPRAWFSVENTIGLVPHTAKFVEQSFRVGNGEVTYIWNFGDNDEISFVSDMSTISTTSHVDGSQQNVYVNDLDGGSITKTYSQPGIYTVSLRVINEFGEDTVAFEDLINVRYPAPEEAAINIIPRTDQILTPGNPPNGPYITYPSIRTPANTEVHIEIPSGENPNTPGMTFSGEKIVAGDIVDPVINYTWGLNDDISHANSPSTRAIYSVGGYYDIRCRLDTRFGSFRITTYTDSVDVVEAKNLWLWTLPSGNISGSATSHEMGLISETFKNPGASLNVTRNDSFLDYLSSPSYNENAEARAKREFRKNVHFSPIGTYGSGQGGSSGLYWASGGNTLSGQSINITNFNGFNNTYTTQSGVPNRPWNWVALSSPTSTYIAFGAQAPNAISNLALPELVNYHLSTNTFSTSNINQQFFSNGAEELLNHPSSFSSGVSTNGEFAVYRSCWQGRVGYILRNTAVNEFFRLSSFYQTTGTIVSPFTGLSKLNDVRGTTKVEGQIVPLVDGIFLFSNSGEFSVFNPRNSSWLVGNVSASSTSFRSLQDVSVSGFDNAANTLFASSDGNEIAYLSYDYSSSAFIKYSSRAFSSIGRRPMGDQFLMGVY